MPIQKRFFLLLFTITGLTLTNSLAQTKPELKMLQAYQWEKRLLLIFTSTATEAQFQKQQQLLKQAAAGLAARDMVTLSVMENQVKSSDSSAKDLPLAQALREKYKVKSTAFEVILIGKDGGEKYRSQQVTNPAKIFQTIDAMPMRQQEMRKNSKK